MTIVYDVVRSTDAISIFGANGYGYQFYWTKAARQISIGPVDPASFPRLFLWVCVIPSVNAMVIPADASSSYDTTTMADYVEQTCPSLTAYWVHVVDPDPRDMLTWYRTTIKGLSNVAPYNNWATAQFAAAKSYPASSLTW